MANRMDAVSPRSYTDRNGEQKTQWVRLGSAFETKTGGWAIRLDALPIPQIGKDGALETTILLMEPRGDAREPAAQAPAKRYAAPAFDGGADDEVPF